MNILVIAKLSPEKLLSKLRPFISNLDVENLFVLRDETFDTGCGKIVFLPTPARKGVLRHLEKVWIAKRFMASHQIDVILSYLLPPHGYIGCFLSMLMGVKWIHSIIAGHREVWMNGKLAEKINLQILQSAHLVNVMGEETKAYLKKKGIRENKIIIIPNAIDGEQFSPFIEKDIKYDIIYASRIDENKNFPLLVNAAERLISEFPQLSVCVAGDGDKLSEAQYLCRQKGLDSIFHFMGKVEHGKIKDLFCQSKIFVLTSRGEGVPMSLLEAMFCGLACISTNVGEIGSIIQDGVNGFLLQNTEDDELLAERIRQLLLDTNLLSHVSLNATKIRSTYSFDNVAQLWNEVLSSI